MTTDSTQACESHAWRSFTEDEMKDLRSKSRAGRPPMAWVEEAEQCERTPAGTRQRGVVHDTSSVARSGMGNGNAPTRSGT